MKKIFKNYVIDICLLVCFMYLEILFQIHIFHELSFDIIYPFLFGCSVIMLLLFIVHLFGGKAGKVLSAVFLVFMIIVFLIQMIYYDKFKVFTSIFSVFHGTEQVLGFGSEIKDSILKNIDLIFLCFIPLIMYLLVLVKFDLRKIHFKEGCIRVITASLFYLTGILCLMIPHSGMEPTLELYLNNRPSIMVMKRFGVITSFRLQLREMVIEFDNRAIKKTVMPFNNTKFDETEVNQMDIDFSSLIASESDSMIKDMHQYFANQKATLKNEYTGMFKDYNLIMITAEAFSDYAIDEQLTPTLYKMKTEGFDFKNFYNPLWEVSTSDGEYVNVMGLYPKPGVWSFSQSYGHELPFVLARQYQKLGVETFAYHNHYYNYYDRDLTHAYLWENYKGLGNGLDVKATWPESDLEMIQKTSDEYMQLDRFHTYFMSVSGHLNYTWTGNTMSSKNHEAVADLNMSELSKGYLAAQIELDKAMEQLLKDLERYDHLDDTLIVIAADHYPYGLEKENIEELSGRKIEDDFDLYKSTLIMYAPSMKESIEVDTICSSIDILPTVSNLLGFEYDSRLLMGVDIFGDQMPLVVLADGSFMNGEVKYDAQNSKAVFLDKRISETRLKSLYEKAAKKLEMSAWILEKDYYRSLYLK